MHGVAIAMISQYDTFISHKNVYYNVYYCRDMIWHSPAERTVTYMSK